MVTGTKRGFFLFGLHTFSVCTLVALFTSFFVEYYIHQCLLVIEVKVLTAEGDASDVKLYVSKWGLSWFTLSQFVYAVAAALHRYGLLSFFSTALMRKHVPQLFSGLSGEHRFVLLFCLSWSLLRFPLLPSAVSFTALFAGLSGLGSSCSAFTAQAAREMALQRPKEGEWISCVARLAAVSVAVAVFVAAALYDGMTPRRGKYDGFSVFLLAVSGCVFGTFSVLQCLRRRAQVEGRTVGVMLAREEAADSGPSSPRLPFLLLPLVNSDVPSSVDFHAFACQTCQRRSMKALLTVRTLHSYAHSLVLYLFHLMLTLGCGLQLSAITRALLLAVVIAAPPLLTPLTAALCNTLGKKRSLTLGFVLITFAGAMALVLAYVTRDTHTSQVSLAPVAATFVTRVKGKDFMEKISTTGTVWCAVLLVLQRLLLDASWDLLDLAEEDVVEEDAILFGRASSMATWTRQLTSVCTIPAQSLSFVVSLLFLAASSAFRVVWSAQDVGARGQLLRDSTHDDTTTTTAALTKSTPQMPLSSVTWFVVANGSTMLALLGLQTCGVAATMCAVWHGFYNLEGKHLQFVQMATRKRRDEQTVALV